MHYPIKSSPHIPTYRMPFSTCPLYSNAYVVAAWRQRGKDKKDAANFGYKTLLPDNIPQSINI